MSKQFLIYKLNEFNYPVALILSLFGDILVFKKSFFFIKGLPLKTKEVFFENKEESLDLRSGALKEITPYKDTIKSYFNTGNNKYDNILIQRLLLNFEEVYFCSRFVERLDKTKITYVVKSFEYSFFEKFLSYKAKSFLTILSTFLSLLEKKLQIHVKSISLLANILRSLSKKRINLPDIENIDYVSGDISGFDHAEDEGEKDFLWPVRNNLFDSSKTLFLTNSKPSKETTNWIKKHNCTSLFIQDNILCLSISDRFAILLNLIFINIKSLFSFNYTSLVKMDWDLKVLIWDKFWKVVNPKFYFSSTSTLKLESPQTSVCDRNGIQAVNWAYANNEMLFSEDKSNFDGLSVRGSVFSAHKILLWDSKVQELFAARKLYDDNYPTFHTIGPLMFGSTEIFNWDTKKVLNKLEMPNIKEDNFVITFFEDPVVERETEINLLIYKATTQKMIDDTFEVLLDLINKYPHTYLVFKAKKPNFKKFYTTEAFDKLINHERCSIVPPNVNQYLPFLITDLAIALPISSSIEIGEALKIPSVHYLPTDKKFGTFKNYYSNSIVQNYEEMEKVLTKSFDLVTQTRNRKNDIISNFNIMNNIKNAIN
jgi:polysaccharide biosynthesis PFTS motif protein